MIFNRYTIEPIRHLACIFVPSACSLVLFECKCVLYATFDLTYKADDAISQTTMRPILLWCNSYISMGLWHLSTVGLLVDYKFYLDVKMFLFDSYNFWKKTLLEFWLFINSDNWSEYKWIYILEYKFLYRYTPVKSQDSNVTLDVI